MKKQIIVMLSSCSKVGGKFENHSSERPLLADCSQVQVAEPDPFQPVPNGCFRDRQRESGPEFLGAPSAWVTDVAASKKGPFVLDQR